MRALPSSSRDLPLLLPEWMLFALLQMAACRTLEMLARGTGLRGDATRAPMQVRNGWRPHRRHLTQPASLSKDDRFFVQMMGSTSFVCYRLKINAELSWMWDAGFRIRLGDEVNGCRGESSAVYDRLVTPGPLSNAPDLFGSKKRLSSPRGAKFSRFELPFILRQKDLFRSNLATA
jgi:hypothetical protein